MKLDPFSLRLFVDIVETGFISAAAERSHTAASAVSKRISDLEAILTDRRADQGQAQRLEEGDAKH